MSNEQDEAAAALLPLEFIDVISKLGGYKEKYDSITYNQLDEASGDLIVLLWRVLLLTQNDDLAATTLKAAYVLGAFNESRGIHAVKQ